MKKLGKFLVVGAVAAVACAALVGCGGTDYSGEYKYTGTHGGYGIGVVVTVDGDTIKKVELKEIEGYANVSESWTGDMIFEGALGRDETKAALPDYLKKFEGKKVSDIKAIITRLSSSK